jgi:hypothetical protein
VVEAAAGIEVVGALLGVVPGVVPAGGTVLVVPDTPIPAAVTVTLPETCAVQWESVQHLFSPFTRKHLLPGSQ